MPWLTSIWLIAVHLLVIINIDTLANEVARRYCDTLVCLSVCLLSGYLKTLLTELNQIFRYD